MERLSPFDLTDQCVTIKTYNCETFKYGCFNGTLGIGRSYVQHDLPYNVVKIREKKCVISLQEVCSLKRYATVKSKTKTVCIDRKETKC